MKKEDDLISKADIQKIAEKGGEIYSRIKDRYDPKEKGKFLAIDVDTEDIFLGETGADALVAARKRHPNKVFYVQKIGFDTAEAVAHALTR